MLIQPRLGNSLAAFCKLAAGRPVNGEIFMQFFF